MKLNYYRLVLFLALFGICLALYLLHESFAPPHASLCYVNSTVNCDASTKGVLAKLFGIPVPFYGLTGFVFMLLGVYKKWPKLILGMGLFGTFFCLRIILLEVFQVHAYCPVCFMCQIVMIFVSIFGLMLWRQTPNDGSNTSQKI